MSDYWEENGLEKPQQIIVCAACQMPDGLILCGARHWDMIMVNQAKAVGYEKTFPKIHEQGFIDQFGKFLDRDEAMEIVKKNGQPFDIERNGGNAGLFSEGLY